MAPTAIDDLWFRANPNREYRLRRQTQPEIATWQVPPKPGVIAWCLIRRADGIVAAFGLSDGEALDDYDDELMPFFDQVRSRAA